MIYPKQLFDLQITFAQKVASRTGIPFERALLEYTNLYVRFGLGRDFDESSEGWRRFAAGLATADDPRDWTYEFYLRDAETSTAPPLVATFGCFSYGIEDGTTIRPHFRNVERHCVSPLHHSRVAERRAELAILFAHASSAYGDLVVKGVSWLYNLEAYRRLFPPSYADSRRVVRGRFRSMPLWGQFVDYRGGLKQAMAETFLRSLDSCASVDELDECFPLQALGVEAQAGDFHEFYSVQSQVAR
jgi:hypothetical protein